jgi:hypothetical protein
MATNKFDIILNLQPSRSPFLKLDMGIFDKFDKMYYRADKPGQESFPFDKNLKNWKIEVLYVDASCIQGKISLKTIGNQIIIPISRSEHKGEPTDTLECEFIIDKFPRKGRSPFFHFWNCGNNMSVKHKAFVDRQLPKIKEQIILKLKQKEFLDRKSL